MPPEQTSQAEEEAKAKARVEVFRTQAVGIVDRAANGETFLALKSAPPMDDGQTPAAPPADAQKTPDAPTAPPAPAAAVKMPAAAKAKWTEVLGAVIDTCAKIAEALQSAEVDDAAPVPMELVQMAADAEDQLGLMVEPYEEAMMAAAPPPPSPPPEGESAQKAAPPPPPPAKPRPRIAMKRIMALDSVAKSLVEGATKVGELVGWAKGAAGLPAPATKGMTPAAKADLDPYTAMNATLAAIRERMWAACDLIQKDPAKAIAELREVGGMLDKAAILATGGGGAPGAAPAAPAPVVTEEAQMAAVQKAVADGVTAAKNDLLAAMKTELGGLVVAAKGAAAQAQAALINVQKSVPAPNGQPVGEHPTPPMGAPPPADPWSTVNNDIKQARSTAAGK